MRAPTKKEASIAAAMAVLGFIWTARAEIVSVVRSDDPPFAGRAKLMELAQNFEQMQKNQILLQQSQRQLNTNQNFLSLQLWQNRRAEAEMALQKNPNDTFARQMRDSATVNIDQINRELNSIPPTGPFSAEAMRSRESRR